MAERLFDDHPPPGLVFFSHQTDFGKIFDDRPEEIRRGGEIEETIAVGGVVFVEFFEQCLSDWGRGSCRRIRR